MKRRFNQRRRGYQYSQARRQPPQYQQPQQIINKEEVSKIVKDFIESERQQEKKPKEEAKIIDCSAFTWEDFEAKFQEIEDRMEISEGQAKEDDYDITVYTDAWDPSRIFEFAIIYWDILNVEGAEVRRDNVDVISFGCYFAAMCELFLAGQDSLDGVDGHTRESIRNAKYELQRRKIPELIGDMFLGLRPIVLKEERVRIVLMPHKVQTVAAAVIPNNTITEIGGGNRDANFMFRPSQIIVKRAFHQPQAAVVLPETVRMNWMLNVINFLNGRGVGHYTSREINALIGHDHFLKRYTQSAFSANLALPITFTHDWYDYWLEIDFDAVIDKWTGRLLIGFGNEFMYAPRLCPHAPMIVIDANHVITWSESSVREQWIPWFVGTTRQQLTEFVTGIAGQIENVRINRLHERNLTLITQREYAQRMSRLVQGAPRALLDRPP